MVEIIVKLPEAVAEVFGGTPEARAERLIEDAAVEEYRAGRISLRQVAEMLGVDYWQAEEFLSARQVPLNYTVEDLQSDAATLEEILARS